MSEALMGPIEREKAGAKSRHEDRIWADAVAATKEKIEKKFIELYIERDEPIWRDALDLVRSIEVKRP